MEELSRRINPSLNQVVCTKNNATIEKPMYKASTPLIGDKESVKPKQTITMVIDVDDDASHRLEYNMKVRERKTTGWPRKLIVEQNEYD